ncbi:MAG: hypothetical protein R2880_12525 [Deinococcales bacterium]
MPLLDGQYQIITEKHISPKHSIFEVLDEADMSLRVMWYQLDEAEEIAFEDYRALLRALRREGVVAIRDVVSRPGAHYVVWEAPPVDEYPRKARELLSYQESLAAKGYRLSDAQIYLESGREKIYLLPFQLLEPPPSPISAVLPLTKPVETPPACSHHARQ